MSRVESWETVARALAARMQHHAGNCRVGLNLMGEPDSGLYGYTHERAEDHVRECPFCADTAAYNRFLRKIGGA